MRLNARHFVVAIIFMFAQIYASAAIADHLGDHQHVGGDCAICTTINTDTDDALPPEEAVVIFANAVVEAVASRPNSILLASYPSSDRARAPPYIF